MMEITRRTFLKLGLMGTAGLVLPFDTSACSGSRSGSTGNLLHSKARLPNPFRFPLPVPPAIEPERSDAGADYYEITQKKGEQEILPGLNTKVWGYEGSSPAPR